MSNKLAKLMARPDRGANVAANVLTKAFRDVLADAGITYPQLRVLIEHYLNSPERHADGSVDRNKINNERGNLLKEVERDEYTFKVFIKLLQILRLKECTITINGKFHDGSAIKDGSGLTYNLVTLDMENILRDAEQVEISEEELKAFKERFNVVDVPK